MNCHHAAERFNRLEHSPFQRLVAQALSIAGGTLVGVDMEPRTVAVRKPSEKVEKKSVDTSRNLG